MSKMSCPRCIGTGFVTVDSVKEVRKSRGYTQAEVAELMGIGRPRLIDIEKGKADVSIKEVAKLAEIYDVDPLDLYKLFLKLNTEEVER